MKVPANTRQPQASVAGDATAVTPEATAAAASPHGFDGPVTAQEVALAELRRLIAAWLLHEPGARLGHDAEQLHQLRVTARRIDATLGLFKRQLSAALLQARKTTKAVLRNLGAARDLDVQLAELERYCATLPQQVRAPALPLRARLESERATARTRMIRALDAEPTRHWLQTLTLACAQSGGAEPGEPAMAVMPERVIRRFRKLRKSVGKLRPKSSMDDYHQVRRRAKQLRYATECGAVMFGKPADDMLKALRRLQDKLGAHQDAYMAQNRLTALAADPASALPPATLFLMGRLAERQTHITTQARQTLTRSWRKVRGRRWKALRARLGELSESARALSEATSAGTETPSALPEPSSARASEPDSTALRH
jgi:CHAD domain-containing protein